MPSDTTQGPTSSPILVVEDDTQVLDLVTWALEDEGYRVVVAGDGAAAIEKARGQRPALVLLDWSLPDLNGDRVAEALRALFGDTLPIVLMTADGRSAEKAQRVGAAAFFHKPFDVETVLAAVACALSVAE